MTKRVIGLQAVIFILLLTGVFLSLKGGKIPPASPPPPSPEPYSFQENAHGLLGTYFDTTDPLAVRNPRILMRRVDPLVDFDWSSRPPGAGMPGSNFSASWTGMYHIDRTGEFTFLIISNDGVRLWLDGELRIDDWGRRGIGEASRFIGMGQGWHSLRLDYRHYDGSAMIRLMWTPPGGRRMLMPADHLTPTNPAPVTTDPNLQPERAAHGWPFLLLISLAFLAGIPLLFTARFSSRKIFLRRWIARLGLAGTGVLAGLFLSELMLHWIPNDYANNVRRTEYLQRRDIVQFLYGERHSDPEISYVYIPGAAGEFNNGEFHTKVRFNRLGFRGPDFSAAPDPRRRRMLVIGDSFAFGWGVEEDETFIERLNRARRDWEALNLGISGFSTRQEWAMLHYYGPILHPQDVIIAFYPNDVPDCMGSFGPFSRWERGRPRPGYLEKKTIFLLPGFLKKFQIRSSPIDRYWRHTSSAEVSTCGQFFLLMKDWCRRNRAKLHVIYIPFRDELQEKEFVGNHREMPKFWTEHQIDWVDATPDILHLRNPYDAYFRIDEHLTPLGHSVVAQCLLNHLNSDAAQTP